MPEITIHETTDDAGQAVRTRLSCEDGHLELTIGDVVMPLPDGALEAVMKRYGKELAIGEAEMRIHERLDVGEGRTLVRFRFMPRYEVIAHDYLALLAPPGASNAGLCELATAVTAALEHLARRYAAIG